jgi:hypothetical protein
MDSVRSFRTVCFAAVLAYVLIRTGRGQTPGGSAPLTVEEVVVLSKAGIAEDVIITKIRMNNKAFDLSPAEILELKKVGISDVIINVLMNPAYKPEPPASPPPPIRPDPASAPPPPPAPPAKHYPPDDHASKVPPEPGLYRFPGASPEKIGVKILLGMQQGGGLGKVLKKPKTIAYLVGAAAETRIKDPAPIFYLRLPDGKPIEEVVLVVMDHKADRRELEMGTAGPKQAEARRQFDYLEVGPGLFKLTTAKLGKGEYLFFQLGSAEPPKGIYGRGFDFGIDEPHK